MGNHDVGRSMASAAKVFWATNGNAPVEKSKALEILDLAAENYIGADAEFDDEFFGETPLSRLVAIAFDASEDQLSDLRGELSGEDDGYLWYDGPEKQFRERYKFC